jgi:hypothetical protein
MTLRGRAARSNYHGTHRVVIRCSEVLVKELTRRAAHRRQSMTSYLIDVLVKECHPPEEVSHQARVEMLLRRIEERLKSMEFYFEFLAEHLGFWCLQWFIHTPPVPPSLKNEAARDGKRRWDKFVSVLRQRLSSGSSYITLLNDEKLGDEKKSDESD